MPDSPVRPADDEARALARALVAGAGFGALGVLEPGSGYPMVSRVALAVGADGGPLALVSALAQHTVALGSDPACSLLVGEPGARGDALVHPRLTLQCRAAFVARESADHADLRAHWLARHPKAKLYIDFGDFCFVRFGIERAFLNGGFGQAFVLEPGDFSLPG